MLAEGERGDRAAADDPGTARRAPRQLEPVERGVLERASVVGKEFWRGAVAGAVARPASAQDVGAALLSLVRKGLVRPEASTFLGDDGFRFRHALIRDAAYAAMPKARARGPARGDSRRGSSGTTAKRSSSATTSSRRTGIAPASACATTRSLCARASCSVEPAPVPAVAATLRPRVDVAPSQPRAAAAAGTRAARSCCASSARRYWVDGDIDAAASTLHGVDRRGTRRGRHAARVVRTARARRTRRRCTRRHGRARRGRPSARRECSTSSATTSGSRGRGGGSASSRTPSGATQTLPQRSNARSRTRKRAATSRNTPVRRTGSARRCSSGLRASTKRSSAPRRSSRMPAHNAVLRAHVSTSLAGLLAMRGDFDEARRALP